MIAAIFVMTLLGLLLGASLGYAAKLFHVEGNPMVEEITQLMPGTHCGQCGFAGCGAAAEAIVSGDAEVTCCPPGGKQLAETLANKLGVAVDLDDLDAEPAYASINASLCTGCTRCYKVCPTDAIVGANKQIHVVLQAACTGCKGCQKICPENCIEMKPEAETLDNWHWPKPIAA